MTIATSGTRTCIPPNQIKLLADAYFGCLGYYPSPTVQRELSEYLRACTVDMICAVLEYTAKSAPRPSWAYARTVIDRHILQGHQTAADFNQSVTEWRQQYRPAFYTGDDSYSVDYLMELSRRNTD